MIEVCDPDADLEVLQKLIKMNTGQDIKLTKKQTCQVYDDIKAGKLPLPPLIMSSNKTYLIDKKSPLNTADYETLFDSSSKRVDIKRVARKVGLRQFDQMTKSPLPMLFFSDFIPFIIGKVRKIGISFTVIIDFTPNELV